MIETTCPSRETLLRYLQGHFDFSQIDSLEEHLEQCPNCEETVAELEDTNDTLMRHLPLAAIDKVEADADAPVWIERLKAGPPTKQDEQSEQRMVDGQGELVANGWADGLASYDLLEVLGKGGMGVVYRGRHRRLGRPVAVKVVRPKLVSAAEAHRRFDREIRILGSLNHPGIVMATDAGSVGPAAYLVMELIDGVDLARLVRSGGPLKVGEACEVARQIAVALSAAHAAGAVHRDVKPSNVMIDNTGRVKLLDFGLACLIELSHPEGTRHRETSLGRLIGTLDYMAPEQAEGGLVRASADLYGLGATLFYLLTGRPPHTGDHNRTLLGQLKALSCEDPPRLADVRLDVPEELSNLVAKLLARNPAERPEVASEVADRLATWAAPDATVTLAEMIPTIDRTDNVEAAGRSLAELVGCEPEERASEPTEDEQTVANGSGWRIGRWLLGLAGFAAAVLGIVLLVQTPEGTLRIESEAKNVQVELVDEADRTTTVQIEQGEKSTRLRAGRYRIRLAGKHDNLSLTPGTIELRRGEERLARIIQLPPDVSVKQNAEGGSALDEPGLRATNEELTPTAISVEYADGRPAMGAEVTLEMKGNSDRPVVVTGKADVQGVAFNRNLPYGKYEMTIKVADGDGVYWSATLRDILLEFGGSYNQKIVAPSPDERATVQVQTEFGPTGLKGLRFGNYVGRRGAFMGIVWSPEPGLQDDRLTNFPVLGDGITSTAVMLRMWVTRDVKQPGGETLDWHWNRRGDYSYWSDFLLLTDENVIELKEDWGGDTVYDRPQREYFGITGEEYGVQYFTFFDRRRADNPLSLKFPPGKLECDVRTLFGRANDDVVQALGLEPEGGREVWLEAKLNNESAWVPRAIDLTDWSHGRDSHDPSNVLVFRTLSLEPGETQTIRVASPEPPDVSEKQNAGAAIVFPEEEYPKLAPYTGVHWEGDKPVVKIGEEWFTLISLDGIAAEDIVAFSQRTYKNRVRKDLWRKRFAEDLVEVLTRMGHPPQDTVTLVVQSPTSSETRTLEGVPMTEANRWAIYNASPHASDQPPRSSGPAGDLLASLIAGLRNEKNLVGLAAMVMVDGQVEAAAADGERKKDSGVPLEIGDRWHLGGITKSITATMIARLIESGQMQWSDSIGEIFPKASIHEDWKPVTLKQLLTHTAGAPPYFPIEVRRRRPALGPECTQARREAVLNVIAEKPAYPPGEKYAYSGVGYTIAGAMAEKVTDATWEDLVKREVFEPLELTEAGFGPPKSADKTLEQPRGHRTRFGRKVSVDDDADNTPIIGPAASIHMTLENLCTYAREHLRGELGEGKLLSAETYKLLHTPEINYYACGWIRKEPGEEIPYTVYWHNGSNTMWYALVVFIPETNMVVAVTSNDGDIAEAEAAAWEIVNSSANQFNAGKDTNPNSSSSSGR